MKTLLRIDCSARISGSHSRELADYFEKRWLNINTHGIVIRRDLLKKQIPHIRNETIQGFYTPTEYMTSREKEATALSDELIEELKSVDEVLINSPLYNLNIPSSLKAYLDQVVRIGFTFNINENGYYGLLENKTAHLITVKGGMYTGTPMEQYDFQESYLQTILAYMGIKKQNIFSLEGTTGDAKSLAERKINVQNLIASSIINTRK